MRYVGSLRFGGDLVSLTERRIRKEGERVLEELRNPPEHAVSPPVADELKLSGNSGMEPRYACPAPGSLTTQDLLDMGVGAQGFTRDQLNQIPPELEQEIREAVGKFGGSLTTADVEAYLRPFRDMS